MNPGRGKAARPDYGPGYALYLSRRRGAPALSRGDYRRAVDAYCSLLAGRLAAEGSAELPCGLGLVAVVEARRSLRRTGGGPVARPPVDWGRTHGSGAVVRDWSPVTLGCVLAPREGGARNAQYYGFRCNRALFLSIRRAWSDGSLPFDPPGADTFKYKAVHDGDD